MLPRWFEVYDEALQVLVSNNIAGDDPSDEFWPYPDNKHTVWQIELKALRSIEVLLVFELLHGRYYPEFTTELVNVADVVV